MLHLALHASAHHVFSSFGIRPLCDIAELLRRFGDTLDWEAAQQRAHDWGAGHALYLTLRLAREMLGAAVPTLLLAALQPADFDSRYLVWARARLMATQSDDTETVSNPLGEIWAARRCRNGWRICPGRSRPGGSGWPRSMVPRRAAGGCRSTTFGVPSISCGGVRAVSGDWPGATRRQWPGPTARRGAPR